MFLTAGKDIRHVKKNHKRVQRLDSRNCRRPIGFKLDTMFYFALK